MKKAAFAYVREISKKINKETVLEYLLYLLPLLAIAFLIFVNTNSNIEISEVKSIRNNITENIKFPYSVNMAKNEVFLISFNLSVKNKKSVKIDVIPDDCIQEILINGKKFPLDGIQGLCDYSAGARLDFSKYVQEGLNHFEFRMVNIIGPGGLRMEIPYHRFKSLSLVQYLFILLFMLSIALLLKKQHCLKLNIETIFACALSFLFVIYAFVELCIRINYELSGIYQVWDAPIYYAVGRGIVNGIAPWGGLWEIKPPGIFLVSAISFKFFDSLIFTYYFQVFVLFLTAAIPIIAYFLLSSYRSVLKLALSMLGGLLLALYSSERSGEFQVESFGAAFGCIAVFAMAMPNFEKRKILWTSLAVIGILGACGFKEPFLFSLFGASLIFCKDIKDWLHRFALPFAIAVSLGFVFLLACGWLGDFLHYLEFMSSTHISKYGSSFSRAMEFHRIYNDLNSFSRGFTIVLLLFLFLPLFKFFQNIKANEEILFAKIVCLGIAFFLSSYAVGLGGEFFEHHYVFALPFYMALLLLLLKNWNGENLLVAKLGLACLVFLVIGTVDLPYRFERNLKQFGNHFHFNFEERTKYLGDNAKDIKEAAAYLDFKMDELGIDRYTFIGNHRPGTQIYGWTKHSPMGPYFNQQSQWFKIGVVDSLISNIEKADVVVIGNMIYELEPQADYINYILNEQFTKQQVNQFQIYFRKNKMRR